jgi:hypothetical protein
LAIWIVSHVVPIDLRWRRRVRVRSHERCRRPSASVCGRRDRPSRRAWGSCPSEARHLLRFLLQIAGSTHIAAGLVEFMPKAVESAPSRRTPMQTSRSTGRFLTFQSCDISLRPFRHTRQGPLSRFFLGILHCRVTPSICGVAMVTRGPRLAALARSIPLKSVMDEDPCDTVLRRLRPTFPGDAECAHQDLADAHVRAAD